MNTSASTLYGRIITLFSDHSLTGAKMTLGLRLSEGRKQEQKALFCCLLLLITHLKTTAQKSFFTYILLPQRCKV